MDEKIESEDKITFLLASEFMVHAPRAGWVGIQVKILRRPGDQTEPTVLRFALATEAVGKLMKALETEYNRQDQAPLTKQ